MLKKKILIISLILTALISCFALTETTSAANVYRWVSVTTITSTEEGNFNRISASEYPQDMGTWVSNLSDYYVYKSVNPIDNRYKYLLPSKSDTSGGVIYTEGERIDGLFIEDVSNGPSSLQKITKGAIWGQVYAEGTWRDNVTLDWAVGKADVKIIADDGTEIATRDLNVEGKFERWTLNDTNQALWPGRYRLTYHHHEKGNCDTGGYDGAGMCSVYLTGIFNFDLVANGDGSGTVIPVGNLEKSETESLGEAGKTTTELEAFPHIKMGITYELKTPFSDAINSAICNVLEMIQGGMNQGMGWIQEILVEGNDLEDQAGVRKVWEATRNITLSLLTLGILIIAFMNILGIDIQSYGLGRMLPRLIIGVVLTYFSFLIAAFLLDMMSAFQALLFSQTGSNSFNSLGTNFQTASDGAVAASSIGELLLLCLIGIGLLLTIVWLYVVLIVRIAMLYIIVAVGPIAFMAYILPFTEKYYKQWWSAFWKWAFIGPAVAFMLWLTQQFLYEGYFGTKATQVGATLDTWIWLITAAVMMWLAANLPLKMGKEIYGAIQTGLKKASSTAGKLPGGRMVKEGWSQYKSRGETRRKEQIQSLQRGMALRGGLIGRAMTNVRQKEVPRLQEENIGRIMKANEALKGNFEGIRGKLLQTKVGSDEEAAFKKLK